MRASEFVHRQGAMLDDELVDDPLLLLVGVFVLQHRDQFVALAIDLGHFVVGSHDGASLVELAVVNGEIVGATFPRPPCGRMSRSPTRLPRAAQELGGGGALVLAL